MEKFLSAEQAAAVLGYTSAYTRTLAKQGKIRSYRRGRNWFFKEEDLKALFKPSKTNGLDI